MKKIINNKKKSLLVLVFVVIGIAVTLILNSSRQDIRNRAQVPGGYVDLQFNPSSGNKYSSDSFNADLQVINTGGSVLVSGVETSVTVASQFQFTAGSVSCLAPFDSLTYKSVTSNSFNIKCAIGIPSSPIAITAIPRSFARINLTVIGSPALGDAPLTFTSTRVTKADGLIVQAPDVSMAGQTAHFTIVAPVSPTSSPTLTPTITPTPTNLPPTITPTPTVFSLIGSWGTTTPLPKSISWHGSTNYNGYIYVVGGFTSDNPYGYTGEGYLNTAYSAKVNPDGTLGQWVSENALPERLSELSVTSANGYVYAIGGQSANNLADSPRVYVSKIGMSGTLEPWSTTTPLPDIRQGHKSVVNNGYLYVLGGENYIPGIRSGFNAIVYYARINADGTLGAWNTTSPLPLVRKGFAVSILNGYLYVSGGTDGGNEQFVSTVFHSKFNTDGSLSAWTTSPKNLLSGRAFVSSVSGNGYLLVLSGSFYSNPYSTVEYNKPNADGSLGSNWQMTNSLPAGRNAATSELVNGYIYNIGGDIYSQTKAEVYFAKLQ